MWARLKSLVWDAREPVAMNEQRREAAPRIAADKAAEQEPGDARHRYVDLLFSVDNSSPSSASADEVRWLERLDSLSASGNVRELVPRLSGTLPRLLAALKDDSKVSRVAEQVAVDLHLLSGVLRIVNSPAHRIQREPIDCVERALVVLGERRLREVIAAATFRPILRADSLDVVNAGVASRIWDDAIDCAGRCRELAAQRGYRQDAFGLYLAGMMQSVGLTAVLRLLSKHPLEAPVSGAFSRHVARRYPALTAGIIDDWDLPAITREALMHLDPRERARDERFELVDAAICQTLSDVTAGYEIVSNGNEAAA